jgi:5'-AMP-activated protein kinase regulatory beta subunit
LSDSFLEEEIEENGEISENNSSSLSSSLSNHSIEKNVIIKKDGSKLYLKEVPYTFTWDEGGTSIKVTGSFCKWSQFYPMEYFPQEKKFKLTLNLPKEIHEYKFIVDGQWKYSAKQPNKKDNTNNINNYIDLTNYVPENIIQKTNEKIKKKIKEKKKKVKKKKKIRKKKEGGYGLIYPNKDMLNTEAPAVQQDYLESFYIDSHTNQNIIGRSKFLNYKITEPFTEEKSYKTLLFGPHISINHSLKCIKNSVLLEMGINHRFRDKNCTLVYYSRPPKEEENVSK